MKSTALGKIMSILKENFELEEIGLEEYSKIKVGPMRFKISAYEIKGIGRLSIMKGSAMLGIMKMDTVMLTPCEVDAPLLSYDRITAMKNDTLLFEVYNTNVGKYDETPLLSIKEEYAAVLDHFTGEHWYDSIKMSCSISKKNKNITGKHDELAIKYVQAYVNSLKGVDKGISKEEKLEKVNSYVEGLLANGGPATDVFVKKIGKEKTNVLFRKYLFGTTK